MAHITDTKTESTAYRFFAHAGPYTLEIIRTAYPLVDADGFPTDATNDYQRGMILISEQVPPVSLCRVVLRQMHEAHAAAFGRPRKPAAIARRRQVVFDQFIRDLNKQGGADTLLALRPYAG